MKTLHSAAPRALKLVVSKYRSGPVAGPALSAIRATVDLGSTDMVAFAPLFEQVGQQLDTAISEPNLDGYFASGAAQIIVAISDLRWRGSTLFAAYAANDIEPLATRARSALASSIADLQRDGHPATPADCLIALWSGWARNMHKRVRAGAAALDPSPDIQVGSLLACFPHLGRELSAIMAKGTAVPVLVIGIGSTGGSDRRKWKLRSIACALPKWSLSSGPVAGRA